MRNHIFISYSHKDRAWLEKLQTFLKPHFRDSFFEVWDDTRIRPGSNWHDELHEALDNARAAIMLVTADFLASDFINDQELTRVLAAEREHGLKILWVAVKPSGVKASGLAAYQPVNNPDYPLSDFSEHRLERELVEIAAKIADAVADSSGPVLNRRQLMERAYNGCGLVSGRVGLIPSLACLVAPRVILASKWAIHPYIEPIGDRIGMRQGIKMMVDFRTACEPMAAEAVPVRRVIGTYMGLTAFELGDTSGHKLPAPIIFGTSVGLGRTVRVVGYTQEDASAGGGWISNALLY